MPRFTLPRPGFCEQCCIVLQRRFAMFMRETWHGCPAESQSRKSCGMAAAVVEAVEVGGPQEIVSASSSRITIITRPRISESSSLNINIFAIITVNSYDQQGLSLCCRRRMVDLGLVFLCSCGIGAMHRGSMGANSADFPGSLPHRAVAFFFFRVGGVAKTTCWSVAGVSHGHSLLDFGGD